MSAPVLNTQDSGIARITLNRPDRLNAVTRELMLALRDALEQAAQDPKVRVVCLTGAGRGFCAGQDLSERDPRVHAHPMDLEALQKDLFHPVVRCMTKMPKPVVASVNGIAAGAGVSLALAADIVLAADTAKFALSFAKVGLSVDAGGGWFLTRALGPAKARALLMLGEALPAQEAAQMGLIHKCLPAQDLQAETDKVLSQLAKTPQTAVQAIKRAVTAAAEVPEFETYLLREAAEQGTAGRDPDYPEGVLSFLEKRAPRFR